MGFLDAVKICLSKYATFNGRAGRAEFWWFYLFVSLVGAVASLIDMMIWTPRLDPATGMETVPQYLSGLVGLALALPSLAVAARRLHDINRSGWWQFMIYGAAVIALVLMMIIGLNQTQASLLTVAPMILPLIAGIILFVWYIRKGDVGANRFGPAPFNV